MRLSSLCAVLLVIGCTAPKVQHVRTEPGSYFITAEASRRMGAGQQWHQRAAEVCGELGYKITGLTESDPPPRTLFPRATVEGYITCNPPESP